MMRDLTELNLNTYGMPKTYDPPSRETIEAFEREFGVVLPEDYLLLLAHQNGGHSEADSVRAVVDREMEEMAVNRFCPLDEDGDDIESLWTVARRWRGYTGPRYLAFALDGGGNAFLFDYAVEPPAIVFADWHESKIAGTIAPSFAAFIDALYIDPEDY